MHLTGAALATGAGINVVAVPYRASAKALADAAGLPGFNYGVEYGILARAGTAKAIVDKRNAAINRAMTQPDVIKQGKAQSFDMNPISPEQFAEIIRNDVRRYAQLAKAANIKAE